jgi:hypothetical protein
MHRPARARTQSIVGRTATGASHHTPQQQHPAARMLAAVSSAGCLPHVLLPQPDADDEVEELRELNEAQTPTGVAEAPELELEGGAVAAEDGAWDHPPG